MSTNAIVGLITVGEFRRSKFAGRMYVRTVFHMHTGPILHGMPRDVPQFFAYVRPSWDLFAVPMLHEAGISAPPFPESEDLWRALITRALADVGEKKLRAQVKLETLRLGDGSPLKVWCIEHFGERRIMYPTAEVPG